MKTENAPQTRFLPAERNSPEVMAAERRAIEEIPLLRALLDAMPQFVMVLDNRRQIVLANRATVQALGRPEESLLGLRFGEALGCLRAREGAGCGTNEHCTVCGAGRAMLSVLRGCDDERPCRMIGAPPVSDRELTVKAVRLRHAGLSFAVFSATDHTGDNRRRALERLFFHDVLNTAGAVNGLSEILPETEGPEFDRLCGALQDASGFLLDQITAQRDLASVENGEYALHPGPCALGVFTGAIAKISAAHPAASGRTIAEGPGPEDLSIVTDRGLLMRVVGNMLKNALEAEPRGATIRLGWDAAPEGGAEIWVRNASVMPRPVQLQLFQRSFSTKGAGRGLGTYSMRLLATRYLKGSVSFRSEDGFGTEFRVRLPASLGEPAQPC